MARESEGGPSNELWAGSIRWNHAGVNRDFMLCNTSAASLADHEATLGRRISGGFGVCKVAGGGKSEKRSDLALECNLVVAVKVISDGHDLFGHSDELLVRDLGHAPAPSQNVQCSLAKSVLF